MYKMEHRDAVNAPRAMFSMCGTEVKMVLDFNSLYISDEDWPLVKGATEDMISLWGQYNRSLRT